jgi:alcohol dehydrogenase (cytochrome c)
MAENRGLEAHLIDHEKTVAVDALTGKEIWKAVIEYPPETTRVVCR